MIVVRKHKGRSGVSVFEWRVYRVIGGPKVHNIQLRKFRTEEEAKVCAAFLRENDARVEAVWEARR